MDGQHEPSITRRAGRFPGRAIDLTVFAVARVHVEVVTFHIGHSRFDTAFRAVSIELLAGHLINVNPLWLGEILRVAEPAFGVAHYLYGVNGLNAHAAPPWYCR